MMIRPRPPFWIALALWAAASFWGACLAADAPADEGGDVGFVRVYVSREQLAEAARLERVRYAPMAPEEFEQLVRAARARGEALPAGAGAAVTSARYRARLEGDRLVDGEAELAIAHLAEGDAALPLEPWSLALDAARWVDDPSRPVRLGATDEGKLVAVVDRPGRLHLTWSLRVPRDAAGVRSFLWEAPAGPASSLTLDLPESLVAVAEHGRVSREAGAGEAANRWKIDLGGRQRARIRLLPGADSPHRSATVVRQSIQYALSPEGLELWTRLRLDVQGEPIRRITLHLDPGLRPAQVLYGDTPLPFRVTDPGAAGAETRAIVEFPEPIEGADRIVRIRALGPIVLDRRWRLPGVRPVGTFWQEGEATLSVASPLHLTELCVIDGRQWSKIDPLPVPKAGVTTRLQYFSADARPEVVLTQPDDTFQLDSGTTLDFSAGGIAGYVVADLGLARGQRFRIEADVAPGWIIEHVESAGSAASGPDVAIADWNVEGADGSSKLVVWLANPVTPSTPIRLRMACRRLQSPLGQTLRIGTLIPLRFRDAAPRTRLVWLRAADRYAFDGTGAESLPRVDPASLGAEDLARFPERPREPLFANDAAAAAGLRIAFRAQKPRYAASIQVEATVSEDTLDEAYRLRITPEEASTRVERLLVRFSEPRAVPLRWTLGAEAPDQLAARRLPRDDGVEPAGETWEVRLRQPRDAPFDLRATRSTPIAEPLAVSLASLPEAAGQQGDVTVHYGVWTRLEVDKQRLRSIPGRTDKPRDEGRIHSTFAYDPTRGAAEAALTVVRRPTGEGPPAAWARDLRLESRYEPDGTGWHLARCRIDDLGSPSVRVILPESVSPDDVRGVWVDGVPVPVEKVEASRSVEVALPTPRRFVEVALHFCTFDSPLAPGDAIVCPLPQLSLPVLASTWTVWLPPEYEALTPIWKFGPDTSREAGWTERLFGPFGRPLGAAPFDPLAPESWSAPLGDDPQRLQAEARAGRVVQSLARRAADEFARDASSRLNWGALLSDVARLEIGDARAPAPGSWLLVDTEAVRQVEMTPRSQVALARVDSKIDGADLLERAHLALLVHRQAIVVTSTWRVALEHAQVDPVRHAGLTPQQRRVMRWIGPGGLAHRIERVVAGEPDPSFEPVWTWQRGGAASPAPWTSPRPAGLQPIDTAGWTAYCTDLSGNRPVRLMLVRRNLLGASRWLLFLAVVGLASWRPVCRSALPAILLGLFVTSALLLPWTYARIASGGVLGILFVAGLRLVGKAAVPGAPDAARRARSPSSIVRRAVGAVAGLLALGVVLGWCVAARGQQAAHGVSAPWAPFHGVLIPVDDDRQPTGEKYHVPETLERELRRRAGGAAALPSSTLIRGAVYRGELTWEATTRRLVSDGIHAAFDLETFARPSSVRLRFAQGRPEIPPEGVVLDGRPVQAEWQQDAMVIAVPESGAHRLEMLLRPGPTSVDGYGGFDVAIPRISSARVDLAVPADAPDVEVASAIGSVTRDRDAGPHRLEAMLGPADRLSVRWPGSGGRHAAPAAVDVEQLLWLRVQPDSVVLDARFVIKVVEGRVSELRLTADPRLRARPVEGVEIESVPGPLQTFRLRPREPVSDEAVVDATFVLAESSGIGNLRLPRLEVRDAHVARQWLAVSVDPSLEYTEAESAPSDVSPRDFLSEWGDSEGQPAFALDLAARKAPWSIATRPRAPVTRVEQVLALGCSVEEVALQFEASLDTTGSVLQFRLKAPAALEIESVSLQEGDADRIERWTRSPDGTITVLLDKATSGRQQLEVRGRLPVPSAGKLALPLIEIEGAEREAVELHLYREPGTVVRMRDPSGWIEAPPTETPTESNALGRRVASYRWDGSAALGGRVHVARSVCQLDAEQTTWLRREGGAWHVEVGVRLRVEQGLLDELRLTTSPAWRGPFELAPAGEWEQDAVSEDGRVSIRPVSPVSGACEIALSSPLAPTSGERVEVPKVKIEGVEPASHLVVVPDRIDGRPVAWEIEGLVPTRLPEQFGASAEHGWIAFRVEGAQFAAVLRPAGETPRIALADIRLARHDDGAWHGAACFDLEPNGMSECTLRLPPGSQLVQVDVSGGPSLPTRLGRDDWQVALRSDRLPQRIEVVYRGARARPDADGRLSFEAPAIDGVDVDRTLWTISGLGYPEPGIEPPIEPAGPLDQELCRLETLEAVIRRIDASTYERPDAVEFELRRWARHWRASLHRVERLTLSGLGQEVDASIRAVQRRAAELVGSLQRDDLLEPAAENSIPTTPGALWHAAEERAGPPSRWIDPAGGHSIRVRLPVAPHRAEGLRAVVGSALAGLAALVAALAIGRGAFTAALCRWPCGLGVLIGLIWWLWLSPSIVGWGIVALSVVASFRSGWRRPRRSGSSVVRVSLSP